MDGGLCREETSQAIACAHEVVNTLGHGLTEKAYEHAIVREFMLRQALYVHQPRYPVDYKGVRVGEFVPDLIVPDRVIVDSKVVDRPSAQEAGQIVNHLGITRLRVGLILNFRQPKPQCRRFVL